MASSEEYDNENMKNYRLDKEVGRKEGRNRKIKCQSKPENYEQDRRKMKKKKKAKEGRKSKILSPRKLKKKKKRSKRVGQEKVQH